MESETRRGQAPVGLDFLRFVSELEDGCGVETDDSLPGMGKKAPACLEHIGTLLSLLDRMASCWWGCREQEHTIEYLCGRAASNGRAALRLMRFGLYDESLLLCRAIGESANLLQLFTFDREELSKWKDSGRRERMNEFRPTRVRVKIEETDTEQPLVLRERYEALSERAAHFQPSTVPQAHNVLGVPMLNGMAWPLGWVAGFGSKLLDLDQETRKAVRSHVQRLDEVMGSTTITSIDDYFQEMKDDPEVGKAVDEVRRRLRELQLSRPQQGNQ